MENFLLDKAIKFHLLAPKIIVTAVLLGYFALPIVIFVAHNFIYRNE